MSDPASSDDELPDFELRRRASHLEAIAIVEEGKKDQIAQSWNKEQEKILKIWAEKAAGYRWLHEESARHYRRLNNRFVYPQIFFSTLAGMGGIGMTSADSGENNYLFGYGIATLNIIIAMLTSFQKFIMAAEKSETHATVGRQFAAFYRNIMLELSLNPRDRTDCLELCKLSRSEYDRLMNVAPSVPQKIVNRFKERFNEVTYKPDIANGLSDMQIWEKSQETQTEEAFIKMRSFYKFLYRVKKKKKLQKNNLPV